MAQLAVLAWAIPAVNANQTGSGEGYRGSHCMDPGLPLPPDASILPTPMPGCDCSCVPVTLSLQDIAM